MLKSKHKQQKYRHHRHHIRRQGQYHSPSLSSSAHGSNPSHLNMNFGKTPNPNLHIPHPKFHPHIRAFVSQRRVVAITQYYKLAYVSVIIIHQHHRRHRHHHQVPELACAKQRVQDVVCKFVHEGLRIAVWGFEPGDLMLEQR